MVKEVLPRITVAPKGSFFLFGARGVGKSTWARETLPGARRFDLLDEGLFQSFLADPALFGAELRTLEPDSWVVVDEVQRIPGLLNEVHRAIEELGLRFALLGSSARKLKTAGTNLLAGRALWRTMYPSEEAGSLFEGWIHTLLRAYGDTGPLFDEIAYWSPAETRSVEVDFLLQRGGEHLALEVKAGARFAPAWLSGLTAIGDLPRLARRVLVYTGTRELRTPEGIEVWPLAKLLTAFAEESLWP